ncbi:MAG: hypothetical protein KDF61_18285, partial [Rhodocyclaceae bacterium]|nr:hypothetical protein [Rhodocyclaceae bacterium]
LYTLDGTASTDPEGERLDYRWRLVDGPRTVDLFDPIAARSTVDLPNDLAEASEFTFELAVFDGAWEDTDTVTITVRPNGAPVLADIARVEVDLGEQARFVASATDPDGEAVTLLAEELPDGATFDTASGEFVWNTDRAGFFTPRIEARDPWGAFDATFVVVLVVDRSAENRPPRIAPIEDIVVRTSEAPTE